MAVAAYDTTEFWYQVWRFAAGRNGTLTTAPFNVEESQRQMWRWLTANGASDPATTSPITAGLAGSTIPGDLTVTGSMTVNGNNGAGVLFLLGGAAQLANTPAVAGGLSVNSYNVPIVLDRLTTPVDVVNTLTETTLYTFTVPAGLMSTNRRLRLEIGGDYLNNSGGTLATSETLRIKFGTVGSPTTVWADDGKLHANSTNRKPWFIRCNITNLGVANSQSLGGWITLGGSPATTGTGEYADDEIDAQTAIGNTGLAIDTTAAAQFVVTVQHGVQHANISYRANSGVLELV